MIKDEEKVQKVKQLLKFHPKGLSISDISQKLKINRNSLAKYLEILLITGQVEMRTYGTAKVYHLSSRVPLSAMMKFANELILVLDDQMTVVQANDHFFTFFGLSREDLIDTSLSVLSYPPFTDGSILKFVLEARNTGELFKEISIDKEGKMTWFKVKFVPLVFDDGTNGITVFFEDVTQQKEYERQLRENEARYRAVVEDQTELISRFLPDGTHVFVNEAYCRYYGKKRENLIGHRFLPDIPPDDLQRVQMHFLSLTPEHPVATIDHRVILSGTQIRWQRWRDHAIFDQQGTLVEYQSLGTDITDQKYAEELLQVQRYLAVALSSTSDVRSAFRLILDTALQIEGIDCGGVYLVDDSTRAIDLLAHSGLSPEFVEQFGHFDVGSPEISRIIGEGVPVYRQYDKLMHSVDKPLRREGLRAVGIIPVHADGRMVASLNLASRTLDVFPPGTERALETIGAQVGGVILRIKYADEQKKSEERYRTLAESAQDAIFTLTMNGTLTYVNRNGAEMIGRSPEQIIGLPIEKVFPPAAAQDFRAHIKDLVALKKPIRHETKLEYENHVIWMDVQIVPQIGSDGSIVQIIGITRDVTLHKIAEDTLRESEEKYRVLVETARDGIIIIDLNGIIIFANTAAAKMYDVDTPKEVVGMTVIDIIAPEFRQSAMNNIQKIQKGLRDFFSTYKSVTPKGREVWVECSSTPTTFSGKPALMVALRDITARKEAEKELRIKDNAIESSTTGIAVLDLEKKIIYSNPAYRTIIGIEDSREIIGKPLLELIRENKDLVEIFRSAESEIAQTGRWADEIQFTKKDGSIMHLLVSANEVKEENKVPICFMLSVVDITGQKKAEERYLSTYGKLKDTIEFIPDPTFIVNRDKQVVAWNKAMETLTGIQEETLLGTRNYQQAFSFFDGTQPILIDLLDLSPHDLAIKHPTTRRFGTSIFGEAHIPSFHGKKEAHFWRKASPLFDKDGNRIGAIESIRDISEWKRAEEFLRQNYEHLDPRMQNPAKNDELQKK